jgi:hypothetical protein
MTNLAIKRSQRMQQSPVPQKIHRPVDIHLKGERRTDLKVRFQANDPT